VWARPHSPGLWPPRSIALRHRTASHSSSIFRPTANRNLRVAIQRESRPALNHPAVADGSHRPMVACGWIRLRGATCCSAAAYTRVGRHRIASLPSAIGGRITQKHESA
jgi:hypothetical protein